MSETPLDLSARDARLLLLHLQGLGRATPGRPGPAALQQLIDQLGFIQLDSIAAVERAHHLTLRSRMPGYRMSHLKTLLESKRTLFEHWTHDASAIPTKWRHHWKHRFERYARSDRLNAWRARQLGPDGDRVIRRVLDRIRREGGLRSRDFEHTQDRRGTWWNWKPAKAALEYLWRCGRLAVAGREGFQKIYDLADRVHPDTPRKSSSRAHIDWACQAAMERLGTATASELAAFFRAITTQEARTWIDRGISNGALIKVRIDRADHGRPIMAAAPADVESRLRMARGAPLLSGSRTLRMLCPFDPVIRDRRRLLRLFDFHYRFEAFVPAAKRQYGYYVLPILEGDAMVGRADVQTDRAADALRVRRIWWQPRQRGTRDRLRRLKADADQLSQLAGVSNIELPA